MKGKQMQEEIKNYLLMVRADRKKAGITKVPEFDERDIKLAYGNGLKSGLWHHSHDYLVKTAGLKEKYMNRIAELEAQTKKMQNCRNCKNQKIEGACGHFTQVGWCRDCETSLCRAEYQWMYERFEKAKELLNEFMRISKASDEDFEHDYSELIAEAEQFINEVEK